MGATIATYALHVDWNGDGDFGDAGEDVTDDFIEGTIRRGFSSPLARVARVTNATFVLKNTARSYSPPLEANVLPRRAVKFDMTYGGTTVTLFRGFLEDIRPDFGQYGRRRAVLNCVDAMAILDAYEGEIALLTDTYADEIIEDVVDAVYVPPSDVYQEGINLFATSAEGWSHEGDAREAVKASQKIKAVCASDWGRFFISKSGAPTYYNRLQMPMDTSTELTLDDTMLDLDYVKGVGTVHNYVEVVCYPRSVGEINEVLGRLSQREAPEIPAGESRTFVLRYRDPVNSKVKVGGKDMLTPVAATDFECTDDEAGEGNNENGNITPSATFYGDHAEVTLANGAGYSVFVQKLQVRGIAIRARERVTMVAQDAASIAAYEKRRLPIQAPLISQPSEAQLLADYLLDYYKDPVDEVSGVEILANKDAAWMAAVRDLELMDRVVLTETQTGLSSWAGYIYQMTHRIKSRYEHRLTMALEQAYTLAGDPFTIDSSTLDGADVLVY